MLEQKQRDGMWRWGLVWALVLWMVGSVGWAGSVRVGADRLFERPYLGLVQGKRVGLITNQSAINQRLKTTFDLISARPDVCNLVCLFAPEHGFYGNIYACEEVEDGYIGEKEIPVYGLFGVRRRPSQEILRQIDLLIYDVQDIGARSYTFISTLFYCMEEAAKASIPLLVLDRPNPMGGLVVDGPLLEEAWRSFLGYINVPYCHGMTVGELARFFNQEYDIHCQLTVIPMQGWRRGMAFQATGLPWMAPSPQIPEPDTAFFYSATGLIGHCSLANIGIGYTLPFKLVGAPWIQAGMLAELLNQQKLPGVHFQPVYYRPFFGKYKLQDCEGVRLLITDNNRFLPVTTQFTIMGILKSNYPVQFKEMLAQLLADPVKRDVFNKLVGKEQILRLFAHEKYVIWKLRALCTSAREEFLPLRKRYLIPDYN